MSMSGICAMRGNVMEYFKPGEQMKMMCYSVMTQAYSEKNSEFSQQESNLQYDLPITSSDALPLSFRRLVGAKAIKLGSWDKEPLTRKKKVAAATMSLETSAILLKSLLETVD